MRKAKAVLEDIRRGKAAREAIRKELISNPGEGMWSHASTSNKLAKDGHRQVKLVPMWPNLGWSHGRPSTGTAILIASVPCVAFFGVVTFLHGLYEWALVGLSGTGLLEMAVGLGLQHAGLVVRTVVTTTVPVPSGTWHAVRQLEHAPSDDQHPVSVKSVVENVRFAATIAAYADNNTPATRAALAEHTAAITTEPVGTPSPTPEGNRRV